MSETLSLPLIMLAALVASVSPGPATLGIAGMSMASGRRYGLALAAGITTGSLTWSMAAAFGLVAVMLANAWMFEIIRYFGAGYLLYLAFTSARSCFASTTKQAPILKAGSLRGAYARGLALHLTNPKAILFFGALFAIGVPPGAPVQSLAVIIIAVGLQSAFIFHGYALLFSSRPVANFYIGARRWFDGLFALAFGAAGIKVLTARLG